MRYRPTEAARRALAIASACSNRMGHREIGPESLLAALLWEPECRAAVMLARHAVDRNLVCQRWPELAVFFLSSPPHSDGGDFFRENMPPMGGAIDLPFSLDVDCSLESACLRLDFLPRPQELATEHLLLGLAAADHAVALWLREHGVAPDEIEGEIRSLYGCERSNEPLDLPMAVDVHECDDDQPRRLLGQAPRLCLSTLNDASARLRVLDASANRAREALRVIEDYVRFALDDRHLTGLCKQLRHDLAEALAWIPASDRLAARETLRDVGTQLTSESERRRGGLVDVVRANFARLQESLRALEEYGKIAVGHEASCVAPAGASATKQLRYRAYTLERAVELTRSGLERLAEARLCVLLDGRDSPDAFERTARALIEAGVSMLQLRDKRLGDRELMDRARRLRTLTAGTKTLFIVNDRPDLARLAGADGVHVGQDDLAVFEARRIVGPEALVGVSTHTIEQARQAVLDGANYIGVGPTFPSATKQFERFPGVALLRAVAAEIRLPAFAIGGISRENITEVRAAGFSRVAVGGAILAAPDPAAAAREILQIATVESQ